MPLSDDDKRRIEVQGCQRATVMRMITTLSIVMALGACGPNPYWRSYDLSLNPPEGVFQAKTECRMRAAIVSGYDWIDALSRRGAAFDYCMYKYGYRFEVDPIYRKN